jgi:pimeloyl-ACP methyl ester carboxylesterase
MTELDHNRFNVETFDGRGFKQAFVREGAGGVPLLLVHGWPETKRIWWRNIEPLAAAGFEVIVPDLRGFGESDVAPDGFGDVPAHSRDLDALVRSLGHQRVVVAGGDLGGPVIQDMSMRIPDLVERMVLFNSPLPYVKDGMADLRTRPASEASDYFIRNGTDPDGLAQELDTPDKRRRYIATFYGSRFWSHPGGFDADAVAFMTEPFADGDKLRASFGAYESVFNDKRRSEATAMAAPNPTYTLVLFGPSDHVLYADFDRMCEVVFPNRVGPYLVKDCGHFLQWERADVLNNTLPAFCRDLLTNR